MVATSLISVRSAQFPAWSRQEETPSPSHAKIPISPSIRNFALKKRPLVSGAQSLSAAIAPVAASAPSAPTIEERRLTAEQIKEEEQSVYRVTEVEAAVPQDFYGAPVLSVVDIAPGVRRITVEAEISREFVPLSKAYTKPGQTVRVRGVGEEGEGEEVLVSGAPFPGESNFGVLYKMRGDIPAGSTKAPQFALSVRGPLELHVLRSENPALFDLTEGDSVEVGPFVPKGMDLRPVMFISRFPTLLLFADSSAGIAAARALVEAQDVGSIYPSLRRDVRLFYLAPSPSHLAYRDRFALWESEGVRVRPIVASTEGAPWDGFVGSFGTAFEEDDFEYDPETTAAVVMGSQGSNAEALKVLEVAGVPRASTVVWEH